MNKETDKTKEQLIAELAALRKESKEKEDKLKASNQQLDANNQQLRATEQQLRAANQQIKENQERLELAMDAGEHGFWDWDLNTDEIYFSPRYYTMLGYEPGELPMVKDTWTGLMHPEDRKTIVPKVQKHVENAEPYEVEFRLKCKDGSYKWISGRGKSFEKDENGQPQRAVGVHVDITERKQAKERLRDRERLLNDTQKLSKVGGWEIDLERQITSWTDEMYRIHDLDPDKFRSLDTDSDRQATDLKSDEFTSVDEAIRISKECYSPEDRAIIMEAFKKCSEKGVPYDLELPFTTVKGRQLWVRTITKPVIKDNRIVKIVGNLIDITERKEAQQNLKESERRLETLLSETPAVIYSLSISDGKIDIDYLSKNLTNALGYEPEELVGNVELWKEKVHPKDLESVMNGMAELLEEGSRTSEYRYKDKDGEYHWLHDQQRVFQQNEDKTVVIGAWWDITERKRAEEELREKEERLRLALQGGDLGTWDLNLQNNRVDFNEHWAEMKGYSLDELEPKKKTWEDLVHPDDLPKAYEKLNAHFEEETNFYEAELRMKHKSGKWIWMLDRGEVIERDKEGNPLRVCGTHKDITKQKRNEQTQNIIHNISNAVITSYSPENFLNLVKDELGKVIDTTNFFVALYDEKTDCISLPLHHDEKDNWESYPAGKTLTNYVIKTGKSLLAKKAMIEKLIQSGEVEQIGHLSEVWLGVPLKSKNKVTGIFAVQSYKNKNAFDKSDVKMLEIISHQISLSLERLKAEEDLKLSKEKAEESDRLKTAFLNNMSHEIRTPLNGITGFIGLLQDSEIDEEEKQQYFDRINKSSDRLIATVTDIMDISRIEAGQAKVSKTEVSVNEILEEQYNFFYHQAKSKGLELNYKPSLTDSESLIVTDRHKLEGILTNLLKNAVKYTETGEITFGCRLKENENEKFIEFYVKDTGIGVPANRVDAIFNRFEQADISDTRAFEGSGLGLAISKSYVEMLGGEIWLESEENKGSVFYFTLPVKKAKETDPAATSNEPTESSDHKDIEMPDKKLKVLVAEDDEESFIYLTTILKKYNWNIIHTFTGRQTIEKYREQPDIGLILMDIKLPDIDGYEATRRIKEINPDVPIIAQTAYALEGDRKKALEAGCDEYISKPMKKETLLNLVNQVVGE